MATTLTGSRIATTYVQLLHLDDGVHATTEKYIRDGDGTATCLSVSEEAVGIGTDSPSNALLHLVGSGSQTTLAIDNTGGDGDPVLKFRLGGEAKFSMGIDDGDDDKFKIGEGDIGTSTSLTIHDNGKVGIGTVLLGGGLLEVEGNYGTLATEGVGAATYSQIALFRHTGGGGISINALGDSPNDAIISPTHAGGDLILGRRTGSTNYEGLKVQANGNVGIGTSSPGASLHTFAALEAPSDLGDFDNYQFVIQGHANTGRTAGMLFTTSIDTYGGSAIVHYDTGSSSKGELAFFTKQSTAAAPPVEVMRLDDTGKVGIGTSSPTYTLEVKSKTNSDSVIYINTTDTNSPTSDSALIFAEADTWKWSLISDGSDADKIKIYPSGTGDGCYIAQTGTVWLANSDRRIKENIVDLDKGLDCVMAMKPRRFNFNDLHGGLEDIGFIAQEMQSILPEVVDGNESDYRVVDGKEEGIMGLSQEKIVPVLVKAIQELSDKITALENA